MKFTAVLGKATRKVGNLVFAIALLLVAVAVGFGGTALFIYHQLGDARPSVEKTVRGSMIDRKMAVRPPQNGEGQGVQAQRVAALPSDQPQYLYASNNSGQSVTATKATRSAAAVPAPLDPPSQVVDSSDASARLNDPESHYILDSRTGRVIGIDGSAGARREEEQDQMRQTELPPQAVAVQTPPPEVRVAAPVMEDGRPVLHGIAVSADSAMGSQEAPVRKAIPVTPVDGNVQAHTFNVAEYLANEDDRPVLRAQAVGFVDARSGKSTRVYRLPDVSRTATAY